MNKLWGLELVESEAVQSVEITAVSHNLIHDLET